MERALREKLVGGTFGKVSATHSKRMGAIRGRGNRTTEARFRAILVRAGIRGWTLNTKDLQGKPDFFFSRERIAVFIDGCFWHGCPACGHIPSVHRPFWKAKIDRNQERDRNTNLILQQEGIRTLRLWEHDLLTPTQCLERLQELLSGTGIGNAKIQRGKRG